MTRMTREECERKIFEKMLEIVDIYKEYNPEGEYLTLCMLNDDLFANNRYYDDSSVDYRRRIDFFKEISEVR